MLEQERKGLEISHDLLEELSDPSFQIGITEDCVRDLFQGRKPRMSTEQSHHLHDSLVSSVMAPAAGALKDRATYRDVPHGRQFNTLIRESIAAYRIYTDELRNGPGTRREHDALKSLDSKLRTLLEAIKQDVRNRPEPAQKPLPKDHDWSTHDPISKDSEKHDQLAGRLSCLLDRSRELARSGFQKTGDANYLLTLEHRPFQGGDHFDLALFNSGGTRKLGSIQFEDQAGMDPHVRIGNRSDPFLVSAPLLSATATREDFDRSYKSGIIQSVRPVSVETTGRVEAIVGPIEKLLLKPKAAS